jgi:hypothetical protein
MGMLHASIHMDEGKVSIERLSGGTYLLKLITSDGQCVDVHASTMGPLSMISQAVFDYELAQCTNEGWPV